MSDLKKTVIKGTIWSVFGQLASLIIVLATNIWMARLLSPKEFGQVGVIMFFITLTSVFTESGLGGALVRKKEATQKDYSTVFVTNLVLSFFCYALICFSAGAIATYYDDNLLKNLLVVAGVVLIINAFQLTQNAKLMSELKFKQKSLYRFVSVLIASVFGVYLAYKGFGVWALIIIQILTALISTLLLWIFEGFFLRLQFSRASFKELYAFGVNTTAASLLNTGFDNVYQLVLAKYFSLAQTGYFYQAKKLQDVPGGIINMVTQSVVFPSLAKLQDDKVAFTKAYNKITLYFLVMLGFISTFVYVYSEPIVYLLYGKEWAGAVFYMQLLTIASFFYIQELINRVIFKVFDQTRQILYLEYSKKTVQAISIGIGIYYLNMEILIIGFVISNIIGYFITYYYSRRVLGLVTYFELFTVFKICIISLTTIIIINFIILKIELQEIKMFLTLPLLFIIFIFGLYVFKAIDIISELKTIVKLYKK